VRLFDCSTLSPLAILREHTETVQCVAMPAERGGGGNSSALSSYVASGAKDGKVAVYQLYPDDQATGAAHNSASALLKHQALYAQLHQGSTPQQLPAALPSPSPPTSSA